MQNSLIMSSREGSCSGEAVPKAHHYILLGYFVSLGHATPYLIKSGHIKSSKRMASYLIPSFYDLQLQQHNSLG